GSEEAYLSLEAGEIARLAGAPAGVYTLEITGGGIKPWRGAISVSADEETVVDLDLVAGAVIDLAFSGEKPTQQQLESGDVTVKDASGAEIKGYEPAVASVDGKDVIRIIGLEGGDYTVVVTVPGYETEELRIDVPASGHVNRTLALRKSS
ncbi:MAG: carboxypeptidase-like regulatory domain-containing protein, partial [Planctomycetes bacterium]|nr:carboxypeptidase-like regulatory domain-containing protein [Planctomycetota bacterium]